MASGILAPSSYSTPTPSTTSTHPSTMNSSFQFSSTTSTTNPNAPNSSTTSSTNPATESQQRIDALASSLFTMSTSTREAGRCCEALSRRSRHLDSLTSPASDASAKLSQASENLNATLSLMKDAREKFDTVSDCEPAILRLMRGAREALQAKTNGGGAAAIGAAAGKGNANKGNLPSNMMASAFLPGGASSDAAGRPNLPRGNSFATSNRTMAHMLSEQDVYAAADSMEILRDAYEYFLQRMTWRSTPSTLGNLERVHQSGVDAMCLLITFHLTASGPAVRVKRDAAEGGGGGGKQRKSGRLESASDTRRRLTEALQNRDLMKSVGEYEDFLPLDTRPVRELRAVIECLAHGGSYLGPAEKRPQPPPQVEPAGNKIIRTEKVGSGSYSNITKKPLNTGFPQLDAYGEARKAIAFASIDGYYKHLKSEQRKRIQSRVTRLSSSGGADSGPNEVDAAARDAVRCLEHAMVVVAGEKSVYRCVISPPNSSHVAAAAAAAAAGDANIALQYKKGLVRSYSHVVSAVVDRTMDIIELVFFKDLGIGQSSSSSSSSTPFASLVGAGGGAGGAAGSGGGASANAAAGGSAAGLGAADAAAAAAAADPNNVRANVRAAASAAAAGLRILDGVRILGPSLAKLCDLSDHRGVGGGGGGGGPSGEESASIAGSLCISIHRTTVKNCARTLENLVKAIQANPLDGDAHRPPDCRVAPVSSDLVRAIRIITPFVSAYKSVTKRRALPWDQNIGEDAGDMDVFIRFLCSRLLSNLQGKAGHYMDDIDQAASAKAPLFLINNTYYLLEQLGEKKPNRRVEGEGEGGDHQLWNSPWFKQKVGSLFQAQKEIYLAHWEILNKHLTVVDKSDLTYQNNNGLLSLESGRLLKSRFSGFTEDFEQIYTLHKPLTVIDPKLREVMQNDVRGVFVPRYTKFFEMYSRIQFSKKNQEQYLKYPPQKVDAMINELYETL